MEEILKLILKVLLQKNSSETLKPALEKLFKSDRFITDLNNEISQFKFGPDETPDYGAVFNQSVKNLLASGNYEYNVKDKTISILGKEFKIGTERDIR